MGKKKTTKSRLLQNIILIAVAVYFLVLLITQQKTLDRNMQEYEKISTKTEQLAEENNSLQQELEEAESDEYLEKKIREILGYVRPDETVFVEREK